MGTTATSKAELIELVEGCRRGCSESWNEMYRAHHRLVASVARKMRLNENEVADVAQAVWMRLYEHIDDIRDASAVKSWLVTTARREAFALMRKQPNTAALTFDVASVHEQGPAEQILDLEEQDAMQRAWERLRPEDALVLDVLVLNGRVDYERAASALGRPIGSLGPTRQRALRRLRQLYDHELSMVGRRRNTPYRPGH